MTARTPAERKGDERARKAAGETATTGRPRKPVEHGQRKGAAQHRRRGEQPCAACLEAEAADRKRLRG